MDSYNIAVILTCFNRKEKTLSCLRGLYEAQKAYSQAHLSLGIYLTDDGCTDGTAQAVRDAFPDKDITILQGDGNLYWAGGMRFAWREALKRKNHWDFYLLLNDDTTPMDNMFYELFGAHEYCQRTFRTVGVYSGVTCDKDDPSVITYGGAIWVNKFLGTDKRLNPSGIPQEVDKTNANILLVAKEVTDKIGIFYEGYRHGAADYDYSIQAKKRGFKALISSNVCGKCERDHLNEESVREKICKMSSKERYTYFSSPVHSKHDTLLSRKRNAPWTYPIKWISMTLNEELPIIGCFLYKIKHFLLNDKN